MAIRHAIDADVPALLPLMRGYCDFYRANPEDSGLERMARVLIAEPDDQGYLLVAVDAAAGEGDGGAAGESDGGAVGEGDAGVEQVVGFAACGWKWSSLRGARVVVLEDLFVAPEARGRGHADALIEAVAEIARRHGAPTVTWLTAPDNHRAQAVYNRVGGTSAPFLEYELEL